VIIMILDMMARRNLYFLTSSYATKNNFN